MADFYHILDTPASGGGLVPFDPPTDLSLTTEGSWQTANIAALNGKTKALIKVWARIEDNDDVDAYLRIYLRKTGSGLSTGNLTKVIDATAHGNDGMGGTEAFGSDSNTHLVELDGNGDFDYYIERGGSPDSCTYDFSLWASD
jgi:hypothetical protein